MGISAFSISHHRIEAEGVRAAMRNVGRILNLETIHGLKGLTPWAMGNQPSRALSRKLIMVTSALHSSELAWLLFGGEI